MNNYPFNIYNKCFGIEYINDQSLNSIYEKIDRIFNRKDGCIDSEKNNKKKYMEQLKIIKYMVRFRYIKEINELNTATIIHLNTYDDIYKYEDYQLFNIRYINYLINSSTHSCITLNNDDIRYNIFTEINKNNLDIDEFTINYNYYENIIKIKSSYNYKFKYQIIDELNKLFWNNQYLCIIIFNIIYCNIEIFIFYKIDIIYEFIRIITINHFSHYYLINKYKNDTYHIKEDDLEKYLTEKPKIKNYLLFKKKNTKKNTIIHNTIDNQKKIVNNIFNNEKIKDELKIILEILFNHNIKYNVNIYKENNNIYNKLTNLTRLFFINDIIITKENINICEHFNFNLNISGYVNFIIFIKEFSILKELTEKYFNHFYIYSNKIKFSDSNLRNKTNKYFKKIDLINPITLYYLLLEDKSDETALSKQNIYGITSSRGFKKFIYNNNNKKSILLIRDTNDYTALFEFYKFTINEIEINDNVLNTYNILYKLYKFVKILNILKYLDNSFFNLFLKFHIFKNLSFNNLLNKKPIRLSFLNLLENKLENEIKNSNFKNLYNIIEIYKKIENFKNHINYLIKACYGDSYCIYTKNIYKLLDTEMSERLYIFKDIFYIFYKIKYNFFTELNKSELNLYNNLINTIQYSIYSKVFQKNKYPKYKFYIVTV